MFGARFLRTIVIPARINKMLNPVIQKKRRNNYKKQTMTNSVHTLSMLRNC